MRVSVAALPLPCPIAFSNFSSGFTYRQASRQACAPKRTASISRSRSAPLPPEASTLLSTYRAAPPSAQVALRTGAYIAAFGLSLLFFPGLIISFFSQTQQVPAVGWIRVGGTLASLFGFYYLGAAFDDIEGRFPLRFYQTTVAGRAWLSAVFIWLVATGQSDRGLLVLAVVNLLSAWSQHRTLPKGADRRAGSGGA